MSRLEFPIYGISVRPQGNGATTTDIILQSKTMLPKVVLQRSELTSLEKNRITLAETKNGKYIMKSFEEKRYATGELKVQSVILNGNLNTLFECLSIGIIGVIG